MNPADLSPIANHLWQSTLFAEVAGLLTLALRNNHARVRHGVWLAASCKFLVPISLLIALGSHTPWRNAPAAAQSNLAVVMDEVSQPFTVPSATLPITSHPTQNLLPVVLSGVWLLGFVGISCAWWVRWRRIRTAVRAGSTLRMNLPIPVISSPATFEPGVFGVLQPVLLLPEGIVDRLTATQLSAVLEHELCHVRHRDNLTASIQMFVETVFWFHPLVWWIGKRMVEERERACDEEVMRVFGHPRSYADAILNICKSYVESPLVCVSGITGPNLRKRIEAIMINRRATGLTFAKESVSGSCCGDSSRDSNRDRPYQRTRHSGAGWINGVIRHKRQAIEIRSGVDQAEQRLPGCVGSRSAATPAAGSESRRRSGGSSQSIASGRRTSRTVVRKTDSVQNFGTVHPKCLRHFCGWPTASWQCLRQCGSHRGRPRLGEIRIRVVSNHS